MLLLSLLACIRPPGDTGPAFYEGPTSITGVTWGCSLEDEVWSLSVETLGWTANGLFSMSEGGQRVEAHELRSVEADPKGGWDHLELELDQVADPRDVVLGSSSAYVCDEPELSALSFRVVVFEPETEDKADCRVWGPELDWNAVAGYSDCDQRLE